MVMSKEFHNGLRYREKDTAETGSGGTHLYSQHSGGRNRGISVSSRTTLSTELVSGQAPKQQRNPVSKNKQTNKH